MQQKMNNTLEAYKNKCHLYKEAVQTKSEECTKLGNKIPNLVGRAQGLERTVQHLESDLKFRTAESEKYKSQVYNLQVDLEAARDQSAEETQALKDKLMLVEGERDALKTSLKEEEVLRIAAEGQIPLPAATMDEHDEFGLPVRSPRKQRTPELNDDDKENVAPKRAAVELKLMQSELAIEKRLRERAQDQVEFMKMECQFRCCSCRIADSKGSDYVHDSSYTAEMQRIKASVPDLTPPASNHGDDPMEDVIIKSEPIEDERPLTPPVEGSSESTDQTHDTTVLVNRMKSVTPEAEVQFSPTTGTFRAVPSPMKTSDATEAVTPAKSAQPSLSAISEQAASSPWTPDANSTMIPRETMSRSTSRSVSRPGSRVELIVEKQSNKSSDIVVHEDAIEDSDDDDDDDDETEPQAPQEPSTPGPYLMRTITTTTTIPLHFSPFTPATKSGNTPMTPSTIAHAPANAQTPVLGELSLNQLPFDRAAALEAIRQRRGRARSMAAGHGTPQKQMMEGVKERRDISAPVSKVRR
jgi:hypothetical protein